MLINIYLLTNRCHTFKANSDGTKDAEISGNNINDIQDAIKAINEQIDAPFERRGGGGGGSGGFREGGGRGYNNDRGNDREGGYNQDGNSYRGIELLTSFVLC